MCAGLLILALAYRPITSLDLGYHLAYGETFLQTGQIVQDDRFISPALTSTDTEKWELLPQSGFDEEGRYHFLNANWLSQVILALLWRLGG
ncbi:MAG: hypothetical protein ACYTFO_06830, partial [Planctomycetota bacterium]